MIGVAFLFVFMFLCSVCLLGKIAPKNVFLFRPPRPPPPPPALPCANTPHFVPFVKQYLISVPTPSILKNKP